MIGDARIQLLPYYIMHGTGLAETANPVGLAGKYYAWTGSDNTDNIPQQNELSFG